MHQAGQTTPGIASQDLTLEKINLENDLESPVLIPAVKHGKGYLTLFNGSDLRKKRVFVLHYGRMMYMSPLIYGSIIPEKLLKEAKKLFSYRMSLDHTDKKHWMPLKKEQHGKPIAR